MTNDNDHPNTAINQQCASAATSSSSIIFSEAATGVAKRKRKAAPTVPTEAASESPIVAQMDRALKALDTSMKVLDSTDDWQTFGNFIAAELRRLPPHVGQSTKLKLNRLLLDCVEAATPASIDAIHEQPPERIQLQFARTNATDVIVLDMDGKQVDKLKLVRDTTDSVSLVDSQGSPVDENISQQILSNLSSPVSPVYGDTQDVSE